MSRPFTKIGDKEVIGFETLIIHKDETPIIFPFYDDKEFELEIEIKPIFENPGRGSNELIWDDRKYPKLVIKKFVGKQRESANARPVALASDEKFNYFISYAIVAIGSVDTYTFRLDYNIFRQAVDV